MAGGFFTRWDSGSLVLTFPGLQPVGLLFAGNEKENFSVVITATGIFPLLRRRSLSDWDRSQASNLLLLLLL